MRALLAPVEWPGEAADGAAALEFLLIRQRFRSAPMQVALSLKQLCSCIGTAFAKAEGAETPFFCMLEARQQTSLALAPSAWTRLLSAQGQGVMHALSPLTPICWHAAMPSIATAL